MTAPDVLVLQASSSVTGVTLRELDNFVAQATAAGFSWDLPVLVQGVKFPNSLQAPGCPFRRLALDRTPTK